MSPTDGSYQLRHRAMTEVELPDHQAIAVHLAMRPGATYKDVAVQLRQDPRTILRWLTAALSAPKRQPHESISVRRWFVEQRNGVA